jgi:hypothetical protein
MRSFAGFPVFLQFAIGSPASNKTLEFGPAASVLQILGRKNDDVGQRYTIRSKSK